MKSTYIILTIFLLFACNKNKISNKEAVKENLKSYEIDLEGNQKKKGGTCSLDDIDLGAKDCEEAPKDH